MPSPPSSPKARRMRLLAPLFLWLLSIATVCGCKSLHSAAKPTPFAHKFVREQLVLHCDFPLPEQHRLIDELTLQRQSLCEKLQLAPTDEPIHVYLFADDVSYYDHLKYHYPGFPLRRAIFVETDVELSVFAHWGDHVAEDLRHEVAHGYLHAAVPNLPLWLDEGLAEYFEVGRGQGGLNRAHVEYLAAQTELSAWKPSLAKLEQLQTAEQMSQEHYAESWAWVHFLLESGDDKANLLTDFLADLRQGASGATLSARLNQRLAEPELALVEYLESLCE